MNDGWTVGNSEDTNMRRSKKRKGARTLLGKYRHQEGAISRWRYWEDGREGNCRSDGSSENK